MLNVGFYKQDLESALPSNRPIAEERIEAVSFYISDGASSALWIVLDFMDFNLAVVNSIKESIASATGIDISHVHVLTTHNHGGGFPDVACLSALCAECALGAVGCAVPARMRYAKGEASRQVSIIRRKYVPELEGKTSLFWGANAAERFDASPFVENAVESLRVGSALTYTGRRETSRPFSPFEEGDKTVFAVEFCDGEGKTIGTIVRFAAHATCANRPEHYCSDYPFHVRRNMEREKGGVCVFLNGPCADIAPGMTDKKSGEQVPLGKYIAECALALLEKSEFEADVSFSDRNIGISLPVREEVLQNAVSIPDTLPESLPDRRKYFETVRLSDTMKFLREKYAEGESSLSSETEVSFGVLTLGKLCIAAFPGETFSQTAKELCRRFPDRDICTATEHGRTAMYIPPREEVALGGYETVCRLVAEDAEERLLHGACAAMQ